MKKQSNNNKKDALVPNWEESEFAKTIDGQIMVMLKGAINNNSFIEAQTLSWSIIAELLLPRLIGWIAKVHKIDLPKEVYKLNAQSINLLYLTFSHDIELFKKLEVARVKRNDIIHKLTTFGDIVSIKKAAAESTKINISVQEEIMKRFNGEVLIPSINLYRDGWNDALSDFQRKIREEISSIQALHNEKQ